MKNTQIIWIIVGIIIIGGLFFLSDEAANSPSPLDVDEERETDVSQESIKFTEFLQEKVKAEIGQPIEGYEPTMFIQVLPSIKESDFADAEAMIGRYKYLDGELVHDLEGATLVHSAASALTTAGMETLFNNIATRLKLDSDTATAAGILGKLESKSLPLPVPETPVACTADAKLCPDGSAVGRTGPDCQFAACPSETPVAENTVVCTDASKKVDACTMQYQPVCGLVQVQCIKAPCPPQPHTFGNGCSACAAGNVISYTEGECVNGNSQ